MFWESIDHSGFSATTSPSALTVVLILLLGTTVPVSRSQTTLIMCSESSPRTATLVVSSPSTSQNRWGKL
jgi:hypothetical protein